MTVGIVTATTSCRAWIAAFSCDQLSLITLEALGVITLEASIVHVTTWLTLTAVRGVRNHHRIGFIQALGTSEVIVTSLALFATL